MQNVIKILIALVILLISWVAIVLAPSSKNNKSIKEVEVTEKGVVIQESVQNNKKALFNTKETAKHDAIIEPHKSFESSKDVWIFVQSRLGSQDSGELYEAYQASRECLGTTVLAPSLQNYSAGVSDTVMPGPLTIERQRAANELISRCIGFIKAGIPASQVLTAKLLAEGSATGGAEFQKNPKDNVDESAMISRFQALESPVARQEQMFSLEPLVTRLLHELDEPISRDERARDEVGGMALMLAMCQIDKDCSRSSYSYLVQYAKTGRCGDSLWDNWEKDFSLADVNTINRLSQSLVSLLIRRR